jgi:hypothetical protein
MAHAKDSASAHEPVYSIPAPNEKGRLHVPVRRRIGMFPKFSTRAARDVRNAAAIVLVTFMAAGAAHAENWKVKLENPEKGSTYNVTYKDAIACGQVQTAKVAPEKTLEITAVARIGGHKDDARNLGAHITWMAKRVPDKDVKRGSDDKCWTGEAYFTRTGGQAKLYLDPRVGQSSCKLSDCDKK